MTKQEQDTPAPAPEPEPVTATTQAGEPGAPPVVIPDIDFSKPTGDLLTGLRKGYGPGNVGGNGPTGPRGSESGTREKRGSGVDKK